MPSARHLDIQHQQYPAGLDCSLGPGEQGRRRSPTPTSFAVSSSVRCFRTYRPSHVDCWLLQRTWRHSLAVGWGGIRNMVGTPLPAQASCWLDRLI